MSKIIPTDTEESFVHSLMNLTDIQNYVDFPATVNEIFNKWLLCYPWLEWWLFNSAASNLFKEAMQMREAIFIVSLITYYAWRLKRLSLSKSRIHT